MKGGKNHWQYRDKMNTSHTPSLLSPELMIIVSECRWESSLVLLLIGKRIRSATRSQRCCLWKTDKVYLVQIRTNIICVFHSLSLHPSSTAESSKMTVNSEACTPDGKAYWKHFYSNSFHPLWGTDSLTLSPCFITPAPPCYFPSYYVNYLSLLLHMNKGFVCLQHPHIWYI